MSGTHVRRHILVKKTDESFVPVCCPVGFIKLTFLKPVQLYIYIGAPHISAAFCSMCFLLSREKYAVYNCVNFGCPFEVSLCSCASPSCSSLSCSRLLYIAPVA